jgi:hypothetical protein
VRFGDGSTQRRDRNRVAMRTAVRRHDDFMRAAIAGQVDPKP